MARADRDLKIAVVSSSEKFELDEPARQLEDLGDAAQSAGRDVERGLDAIGDAARDAGREVDQGMDKAKSSIDDLGDKADATKRDLSAFMDKLGRDAKAAGREVDQGMHKASEGVDEFKDEARSSGKEAAASFSGGFDDVGDFVQETLANAFAGLGAIAGGAGIAAAVGLGIITSKLNEAKQKAQELRAQFADGLIEGKGRLDFDFLRDRLQEIATSDDFQSLARKARDAQVPVADLLRALAGDPAAIERTNRVLAEQQRLNQDAADGSFQQTARLNDLQGAVNAVADAQSDAVDGAAIYAESMSGLTDAEAAAQKAAEDHATAVSNLGDALDGFAEPAGVYAELLATKEQNERDTATETAKATKSTKDSWKDYARDVKVSVGEYLQALEDQVVAQEQWATNLGILAKRGVEEGVIEELAKMGPEGAPLVAALTKASDTELAKLVDLYARQGKAAGDAVAAGIVDAKPRIVANARELHDEVRERLARQVNVPVGITPPAWGAVSTVRSAIEGMIGTVHVPIMLQGVQQSIWVTAKPMP